MLTQPRIVALVAGQDREGDAAFAAGDAELLDAIAPIVEPAEAAQQHEAALRRGFLDQEIDRERVLQAPERREPQRQAAVTCRHRQRRKVAVGEGQDEHISRRQGEVDGILAVVEPDLAGREKVHRASLRSRERGFHGLEIEALEADHGEASVTSLVGAPGPVEMMPDAAADALNHEPHRLAPHGGKALQAQHALGLGRLGDARRELLGERPAGNGTATESKSSWS